MTASIESRSQEWHIITCEYPPSVGGVSDYTFTLATSLAVSRTVHVWCPTAPTAPRPALGVVVHDDLASFSLRELFRLGQQLDQRPGPRRLFVQWVPQGFGYRSLNVGFAAWLAWRTWIKRDLLHLMVHEPYLRWSRKPTRLVASFVHRVMLTLAASGATRIWLSTASWERLVRPYVPRRTRVGWLPVPASWLAARPEPSALEDPLPQSKGGSLTIGHFSMHSPLISSILAAAIERVLERSDATVLLIGRNSDTFRAAFLRERPHATNRVRATGVLSPESIEQELRTCAVMMQPYHDGITTRRTSALTLLAFGLPIVTNTGLLTEEFWRDCKAVLLVEALDGQRIGDATLALLADSLRRASLGTHAMKTYDSRFAPRHAVAMLEAAAWAQPDAS